MSHHDAAVEALAGGAVVAFTGAGISQESRIPTFRDAGGMWERFDPEVFGTWSGLVQEAMRRPDSLADFLVEVRRAFADAHPNPAHLALADLERAGIVRGVVTQNVDGLHTEAGSVNVVELHGTFLRELCIMRGHRRRVSRPELVAGLDRVITGLRTAFIPSLESVLPRCAECGGPARPDFVAFGEDVQDFDRAERLALGCRVVLVVGTHGEVEPAASIPRTARAAGATVIQVGPTDTTVESDVHLRGSAGRVLAELAGDVLARAR